MSNPSRFVTSNQNGLHSNLEKTVTTHLNSKFLRPIAEHNREKFNQAFNIIDQNKIIFDSGCGNGKSTLQIAKNNPNAFVLGLDKSLHRLQRSNTNDLSYSNFMLLRVDLIDFYRLANQHKIQLYKHYILYPNPWPKKQHLNRRWHGSPVFKDIIALGGQLELRSNWPLYIEEFSAALSYAKLASKISATNCDQQSYISDFEAKYHRSGHQLHKLNANLNIDSSSL